MSKRSSLWWAVFERAILITVEPSQGNEVDLLVLIHHRDTAISASQYLSRRLRHLSAGTDREGLPPALNRAQRARGCGLAQLPVF
jgi:hypothetical protein